MWVVVGSYGKLSSILVRMLDSHPLSMGITIEEIMYK